MTDQELAAAIRAVRERVEKRDPGALQGADLMPLLHARDAAQAKVAAIGTVNPRPPGFTNSVIQRTKSMVARALNWHVREQVEFNRAALSAFSAALDALNETNRSLESLGQQVKQAHNAENIHTLKAIAELHAAFQQKTLDLQTHYQKLLEQQHGDFRSTMESLIHHELRLIRQRAALEITPASEPVKYTPPVSDIDWLRFAEHFRGPEEKVREHQRRYALQFKNYSPVLDLGCGRGEFLEAARDAGLEARGVEAGPEFAALCRSKNLFVDQADVFAYLAQQQNASWGGVFCSHVIEHFPAEMLPGFVMSIAANLRQGGLAIFETPDPASQITMATFFTDPTHTRPVPSPLLSYYLAEAGFGNIRIEAVNDGLDYAVFAQKL